ncbi:MAG: hypothetical protein JXR80_00525, partial [Deltaproteobacteria bacterium]|nr:hypothetical protein [Deltaproteobacteria bacterium]
AVLVSGGPGQEIETVTWPGSGTTYTDAANDDIVLPVTLQAEAIELATTTLHSLARKVCSYIWNNDNGSGTWYIDDHMTPLDDFLHEFDLDVDFYKIDPWGNNYQWLGSSSSPSNSFRSSGPDGTSSTADDIVVAARISGCGGTGHEEPNPIDGGSLLGYINFEEDQIDGNNIHIKAPHGNNVLGHQGARLVDHYETGDDYDGPPTASAGAYAAYFDGVGDFIEFNSTNAFSLTCQGDGEDCTNGDLTLTAWCKNDGAQSSQAFVISARDMENKSSYEGSCYFLGTEGKLVGGAWADYPFGGLWEGDGSSISNRSTENAVNPQIPENEWYFMAMVFDNGVSDNDAVLRLYYYYNDDGSFYNENKFLKIERTNLPSLHEDAFADKMTLYIGSGTCPEGKNKYKACNFFHGWIDEVAIFSEALTEEQIKIVMKGQ